MPRNDGEHGYSGHCSISTTPKCRCWCKGRYHGRYATSKWFTDELRAAKKLLKQLKLKGY